MGIIQDLIVGGTGVGLSFLTKDSTPLLIARLILQDTPPQDISRILRERRKQLSFCLCNRLILPVFPRKFEPQTVGLCHRLID